MRDREIKTTRVVWSNKRSQAFFEEQILPRFWPGAELDELRVEDTAYLPAARSVATYRVRLKGDAGAGSLITLTFAERKELKDRYRQIAGKRPKGPEDPPLENVAIGPWPKLLWLAEIFPTDGELRGLSAAIDSLGAKTALSAILKLPEASIVDVEVGVLQYRAHNRCVFEYAVLTSDNAERLRVVGKLYADASQAETTWQAFSALHAQVQANAALTLPRPLGFQSNTLYMEFVTGTPLREILRGTPEEIGSALARTLDAVSVLHGATWDAAPAQTVDDMLARARSRISRIEDLSEEFAEQVNEILDTAEEEVQLIPPTDDVLLHGDLNAGQLLFDAGPVKLLDYDNLCRGNPGIDVGNFAAQLRRYLGDRTELRTVADDFVARYVAQTGIDVTHAARVCEVLSLLNTAIRKFEENPRDTVENKARAGATTASLLQEVRAGISRLQSKD